jgi:hypothetical protein
MRHDGHTVQGDIIYEVDNFVVFRQPFNLWASVFNGSFLLPSHATPLPLACSRHTPSAGTPGSYIRITLQKRNTKV